MTNSQSAPRPRFSLHRLPNGIRVITTTINGKFYSGNGESLREALENCKAAIAAESERV